MSDDQTALALYVKPPPTPNVPALPPAAPDYKLNISSLGNTRVAIRFVPGFRISWSQFDGVTWLHDGNPNNFAIPLNELPKLLTVLRRYYEEVQYTIDAELLAFGERELKRERESLEYATAKDAPEITDNLRLVYRPTQRACRAFIQHQRKFDINGVIVALDTGAGKTAVIVGDAEENNFRSIIVTKAALILNIQAEIKKLTGKTAVVLGKREPGAAELAALMNRNYQYFIVAYEVIGTVIEVEGQKDVRPWIAMLNMVADAGLIDAVYADEAHSFGNIKAKRTRAMLDLKIARRIPMTATPIVNNGIELFPLLKFIAPETFHSESVFSNTYFWQNGKVVKNAEKLQKALLPYMFRRSMKDMYGELPPVIHQTHKVEITAAHKARVKAAAQGVFLSLEGYTERKLDNVLVQLNAYRQIISDAKEEHSVALVQDMLADTNCEKPRKVILFFAFVAPAIRAAQALGAPVIHGGVTDAQAKEIERDFMENPETRVLVATIKKVGLGFTLTEATDIVFNDIFWTSVDHKQGYGRAFFRLNNMHGGIATYVETDEVIDGFMAQLIVRKAALIDTAIEGTPQYAEARQNIIHELVNHLRTYGHDEEVVVQQTRTSK